MFQTTNQSVDLAKVHQFMQKMSRTSTGSTTCLRTFHLHRSQVLHYSTLFNTLFNTLFDRTTSFHQILCPVCTSDSTNLETWSRYSKTSLVIQLKHADTHVISRRWVFYSLENAVYFYINTDVITEHLERIDKTKPA